MEVVQETLTRNRRFVACLEAATRPFTGQQILELISLSHRSKNPNFLHSPNLFRKLQLQGDEVPTPIQHPHPPQQTLPTACTESSRDP